MTTPGGDDGIPLRSVGDVQRELAKVYRDMRKGRIPIPDGNGLTQTLQYLAKVTTDMRGDEIEKRLKAIEERHIQ